MANNSNTTFLMPKLSLFGKLTKFILLYISMDNHWTDTFWSTLIAAEEQLLHCEKGEWSYCFKVKVIDCPFQIKSLNCWIVAHILIISRNQYIKVRHHISKIIFLCTENENLSSVLFSIKLRDDFIQTTFRYTNTFATETDG